MRCIATALGRFLTTGAKVLGIFVLKERKFYRNESSTERKLVERSLPRNESSTGAKVLSSECSTGTKVLSVDFSLPGTKCRGTKGGCDHIGHKPYRPQPYRPQQDDIGHNKKPYRPHGKSISATIISATKYTASLFSVIVSILLCFV